ncbi:MAG: fibronectin type III domain-containing protein [Acidimicrobiia bacterium]
MRRVFRFARGRAIQAGLATGLVVAVVLGLAAPGWTCNAIVQGSIQCTGGNQVITWSITNDQVSMGMTIAHALSSIGSQYYTTTGWSHAVGAAGSTSATTSVPEGVLGTITLNVYVTWANGYAAVDGGSVALTSNSCNIATTSTTTTTTSPATTTTSPATTTTYPTTTTTYPTTTTTSTPPICDQLVATPGNGRAVVRWKTAPGRGVAPITDYVVTPYIGTSALLSHVVRSATTSDVVSGLVNGKTYRFRVTAETKSGTGPPSDPTNAVTIGVPTAPMSVTAAAQSSGTEVRWKAPTTTNGSRITAYVVTPYRNGVALPARVFSPHATHAKFAGLAAGHSFTFRVAARNHRGLGPQSSPSNNVMPGVAAFVQAMLSWFV